MLQPVTVRKKRSSFEIVCGSRRVEASKLAQLKEVPCIVRTLTDSESLDLMITENLQRENISPLEEAKAFQSLLVNHSSCEISHRFGKSEKYIRSRIKLNELTTPFKELLNSNANLDVIIVSLSLGSQLTLGLFQQCLCFLQLFQTAN